VLAQLVGPSLVLEVVYNVHKIVSHVVPQLV